MFKGNEKTAAIPSSDGEIDTLIGEQSRVIGDLRFSGGVHIDGFIEGTVVAEKEGAGTLTLSESGTIDGSVDAATVIINGKVRGDVRAREKLRLESGARVEGNVYYRAIEMLLGAQVNGQLIFSEDASQTPSLPRPEKARSEEKKDEASVDA